MTPVDQADSADVRLTAWVHGHVQGVGFRWWVRAQALELGLVGWATNLDDGRVEVVAEGDRETLARLVERLREGPPAASVTDVQVRVEPAQGLPAGFAIRSGAHRGD